MEKRAFNYFKKLDGIFVCFHNLIKQVDIIKRKKGTQLGIHFFKIRNVYFINLSLQKSIIEIHKLEAVVNMFSRKLILASCFCVYKRIFFSPHEFKSAFLRISRTMVYDISFF